MRCASRQESMPESEVAAIQDRFVYDIEEIIRESEIGARPRKRIVMLSGGIDSLFLLVVLRKILPHAVLHTIHVRGTDGNESLDAKAAVNASQLFTKSLRLPSKPFWTICIESRARATPSCPDSCRTFATSYASNLRASETATSIMATVPICSTGIRIMSVR